MTKKILSVLLAIVMMLTVAPISVFAAGSLTYSVTDAVVGENVTITIGIKDLQDTETGGLMFYYDSEFLEYVKIKRNPDSECALFIGDINFDGDIVSSFIWAENAERDRDLVDVTFKVLKEGTSYVTVDVFDWSGTSKPAGLNIKVETHVHDYNAVVTAPTCQDIGYTTYTCSVCGDSYADDYVDALGHVDENADSKCDVCGIIASGDFFFSVTDAKVGETVEVTIGTDFDLFESGVLRINFDSAYLEYVSCGSLFFGGTLVAGIPANCTQEDGVLSVGMMREGNTDGLSNFIRLKFNVLKEGTSTLSVNVQEWNADSTPADASITIGVHEHDYAEVVTAPTCVEAGYITYTCSVCGDSYVDNYDYSSVPHIYGDDMYCDICGEYALYYGIENDTVVIYGCDYLFTGSLIIPDTIEGYPVTSIFDHAFEWHDNITEIIIPASVTEISGEYVFWNCSALDRILVDENNQNYSSDENGVLYNKDKTEIIAYPCNNPNVEYTIPDTVTSIVYAAFAGCASLKSVDIPDSVKSISAKSFVNCDSLKEITVPESVTSIDEYAIGYCWDSNPYEYKIVDGFTIYSYAGSAAETYANENGITFVALCKHETTVVKNAVEATCTADGYTGDVHCEKCDELLTSGEAVAATGHTEEVVAGKDSTCAETGLTEGKKCSVCEAILTEQTEIPVLAHTEEVIAGKDATCTETGLTEGKKCSVCEAILTEQTEIPALGHTEEVIAGKDATCTETGLTEGKKCSVCGEILAAQEEIAATGHVAMPTTGGYMPTCVDTTVQVSDVCCNCDEIFNERTEIIPGTGHTEEIVPEVPATYTATGLTEGKKCSVCGVVLVEQTEIPMLINPNLTTDSADITVTDKLANLTPEMSVEDIIKSVENENVQIFDKDGTELATDALVGTGSKIQVLDNDGNVLSEYEVMVKSDVDGNGKITPADARLALRASANLDKLEGVYETAANYDGEKTVSTSDARMILRKSAGLE